jgi:SAM-dependent methyltransferase
MPWWARIVVKLILSRLPVPYRFWRRLSLFRHGQMDKAEYALRVFEHHFSRFEPRQAGFVGLELGPGDSLLSAVIGFAHGATQTLLVDSGPFASADLAPYRSLAELLARRGLRTPPEVSMRSTREILAACHAKYQPDGLASLRAIPDATVDFIWSQAVLEHIRRSEFLETLRQMRRILTPHGIASHRVDLRDHVGGGLDNLRFSPALWESPSFAVRSGFYTNRIRYPEMIRLFEEAGFSAETVAVERWQELPTPLERLDQEFRSMSLAYLLVSGFDVVLRPIGSQS